MVGGKTYSLGAFDSEIEAARAYNAAVRHFALPEERLNADVNSKLFCTHLVNKFRSLMLPLFA